MLLTPLHQSITQKKELKKLNKKKKTKKKKSRFDESTSLHQ